MKRQLGFPEIEPSRQGQAPGRLTGVVEQGPEHHPVVGPHGGCSIGTAGGIFVEGAGPPDVRAIAIDALGLRVSSLSGKVDQDSRKITTLTADLEGMRNQVASLRNNIHNSASAEKPSSRGEKPSDKAEEPRTAILSEPPREIPPPVRLLQAGVDYFQKKNYAKASEIFAGLSKTRPDDARVWYYAALLRGLATRDWKGETERLVTQGVDREKAGKPSKSQIDAAFADLTTETGKDWLAFYRRRAG